MFPCRRVGAVSPRVPPASPGPVSLRGPELLINPQGAREKINIPARKDDETALTSQTLLTTIVFIIIIINTFVVINVRWV